MNHEDWFKEFFIDEAKAALESQNDGVQINNQDITVRENGEYTADADHTGIGKVVVDVPEPEIHLQNKTVTENGSYSADEGYDGLGKVDVNIPVQEYPHAEDTLF